jgi:hypothetical protein
MEARVMAEMKFGWIGQFMLLKLAHLFMRQHNSWLSLSYG